MRRVVKRFFAVLSFFVWLSAPASCALAQTNQPEALTKAATLIQQQKYAAAIGQLEQFLEQTPNHPEGLTYLAAAHLYRDKDYVKTQKRFDEAKRAGGGASFLVNHSHEMAKMSTDELTDYCRGWLHLRADGVLFAPEDGAHGFRWSYGEITEFKKNLTSPLLFHIAKGKGKEKINYNFRPGTRTSEERLLVIIMHQKFAQP